MGVCWSIYGTRVSLIPEETICRADENWGTIYEDKTVEAADLDEPP